MAYRFLVRVWITAAVLIGVAGAAWSQAYPTRPITLVVPLPAGGTADVLARIAAEQMRNGLGQTVVVENRPGGAGGLVGAESVFKAQPDGYTLLCAPQLTFSVANVLNPKLSFNTRAFEPVSVLAAYPAILLAKPDLPVATTAELISYAKANPGKLNYGSQGIGQIGHLFMAQFMHMSKVQMVHVPFRGSAPAITALISGQIDLLPDLLPVTKGLIESGKIKLLATGGTQRLKAFPNVPTLAETLPGFEADTWMGIVAPPGTPKEITAKISEVIGKGFRNPEVNARIAALHVDPLGTTPQEMAELIRRSADRWSPLIQSAGIKFE
jgi:tripartite-type tricarboxylate transporter receptor subunit TctC